MKFSSDRTVITAGIARLFESENLAHYLTRHFTGDWGDVEEHDQEVNDKALENGERLMSVFKNAADTDITIWIVTERDRSVTTILLPEEY